MLEEWIKFSRSFSSCVSLLLIGVFATGAVAADSVYLNSPAGAERFGRSADLVPVGTIAAVFEEVKRGQSQFGVVPMENSTDGRVNDTLECFSRSPVRICCCPSKGFQQHRRARRIRKT